MQQTSISQNKRVEKEVKSSEISYQSTPKSGVFWCFWAPKSPKKKDVFRGGVSIVKMTRIKLRIWNFSRIILARRASVCIFWGERERAFKKQVTQGSSKDRWQELSARAQPGCKKNNLTLPSPFISVSVCTAAVPYELAGTKFTSTGGARAHQSAL